jgi:hypothetical protein
MIIPFLTAIWLLYVSSNSGALVEQSGALLGGDIKCDTTQPLCSQGGYTSVDRCKEAGDQWIAGKNAPKDFPRTYICRLEK